MTLAWMMLALFTMVLINIPIAVALAGVGTIAIYLTYGELFLTDVALTMYEGATKFPLIAIPLFVLAGAIMNTTGISRRLINLASALLGFIRGGLAMVNCGVSMFFAEISGSAVADVAAIGSVLIPQMKEKGYPAPMAAAITSSSASLAIILPPSIPMILYAVMAQTSVVQLFVAGIVPGLIGGLGLMGLSYYFARRYNLPVERAFSWRNVGVAFKEAGWALTLPVIILGGILGGFVTATEGAGLAVLASIIIGVFLYREISMRDLWYAMIEGGVQTGVVMLLVASSALVGLYLTMTGVPQQMAADILSLTQDKYLILLMLNVLFLFLGMILHSASAIILVVPIVMPLVKLVGIDPVHFGLVVTLNLAIGQQTPPVASVLMTACAIAKADIWDVTKVNVYYIGVLLMVLILCTYVPIIPLYLVELFYR